MSAVAGPLAAVVSTVLLRQDKLRNLVQPQRQMVGHAEVEHTIE